MKMKPVSQIKVDLGINANGRVQKFLTDTCYRYMNKYVPLGETGNLRGVVTKGSNYITYEMPYANAQYVGFTKGEVKNYTTPRYRLILGYKNDVSRKAKCNKRSTGVCKWK